MPRPEVPYTPPAVHDTTTWLLDRASLAGQALLADELAGLGLNRRHHLVLAAVEELGPAAQAPLCRRIGVDGSDMVALIGDLEERGLVTRERDTQDRRRNSATATPAGRRMLVRLARARAAAEDRLLADLSTTERDRLRRLLARVVGPATTG